MLLAFDVFSARFKVQCRVFMRLFPGISLWAIKYTLQFQGDYIVIAPLTLHGFKILTEAYLAIALGDFYYNLPRKISSVSLGGTGCDMGLGFCVNVGLHHDLCSRSSWTVVFSRQEWSIYSASGTIEPVITSLHSNIHSLCALHAQVREAWRGFCCSPIAPPHNNSTVQMLVQFFKMTCSLADRGATN